MTVWDVLLLKRNRRSYKDSLDLSPDQEKEVNAHRGKFIVWGFVLIIAPIAVLVCAKIYMKNAFAILILVLALISVSIICLKYLEIKYWDAVRRAKLTTTIAFLRGGAKTSFLQLHGVQETEYTLYMQEQTQEMRNMIAEMHEAALTDSPLTDDKKNLILKIFKIGGGAWLVLLVLFLCFRDIFPSPQQGSIGLLKTTQLLLYIVIPGLILFSCAQIHDSAKDRKRENLEKEILKKLYRNRGSHD